MKRITVIFLTLLVLLVNAEIIEAAVSVNAVPSSFTIPRGVQTIKTITYNLRDDANSFCTLATSNSSAFGNILDVNTPLTANLTGPVPSGTAVETLVIPVSVIKKAEQLGTNSFIYRRTFTFPISNCNAPASDVNVDVAITVTSEAGSELKITSLQLYFENRKAEITIKRDQPSLKAFADINFTGTGLLQGYWEVDGRILSHVNKHLVYGRSVTIETPDTPPLPTFDPGTHILRFVMTNPSTEIPLPEALYFVTTEESRKILPIHLVYPENNSEIDYSPATFTWDEKDDAKMATYLIEFYEDSGEKPVFSAYTKKTAYRLPPAVLRSVFSPGEKYQWKVKGFDPENKISGESSTNRFTFKELISYVPGQVVVVAEGSQKGIKIIENLSDKHGLRLIENYDIKSVKLRVAVFQTDKDIFRLMNILTKEKGVILVQPNFIFRTMAEPMSDMQNMHRLLNLTKLHRQYRGKGVNVAVIDTGIDTAHRDLKDRIVFSTNLLKDSPYGAELHGTAVAGVIGASINGFGINGVAPEAGILALRACKQISETHPEGECYSVSVARAIDIAIGKKADIVNMSFGLTARDRLLTQLIDEGAKKGILFVAPAGNMPRQKDLDFPASHPAVLAVGGTDDGGNPYPNKEIASKAAVCASALNVLTTIPGDKHNFLSGTSMSSAMVAGILALATEKRGSVDRDKMPAFHGDICKWEEELLKIALCGK